jgi:hypothetical protein
MAMAPNQTPTQKLARTFVERWFFTGMAIAMLVISLAGFVPAIVNPVGRRAPLTFLAATHGIVFFAWLLLFLTQSLLIVKGHARWHQSLGFTSIGLLALMIPLGFETTAVMVRRGFDLSGDQHIVSHPHGPASLDVYQASIFNFGGLLLFAFLAVAAIYYRRRPEIHKRLMLYANISLMGAPITHLIGHNPPLVLTPPAVLHMIHDFAEFTGGTPAEILTQLQRVFVEQIRTMRSQGSSNVIDSNSRLIL